jgi:hypothetical protein
MSELQVPTFALQVEIGFADGTTQRGRIFLPTVASLHTGPTRPEEWLNDETEFFPYSPEGTETSYLASKREVVAMSVPALSNIEPLPDDVELPQRRVVVECRDHRYEGVLLIDVPGERPRVLDHMNRRERFVSLRDGDRHHLIQKRRITRIHEIG